MKGWWNLSTNLLLFCFLILCGRDVKGSTCPLTLAQLHMQSSSFSFMRLQPQIYRFKGTGLGRPTLAVRSRPWVPAQPIRKKTLAFLGSGHLASDATAGTSSSHSPPVLVYTAFSEGNTENKSLLRKIKGKWKNLSTKTPPQIWLLLLYLCFMSFPRAELSCPLKSSLYPQGQESSWEAGF